ncbi:MAG: methylaspartate ammonia-lyase [Sphingomonadales bacterium]|nr:methylaspartate ammonia-lyase [Sphingomonadales bacterium]MBK6719688.1 methylaspartate ammonia-lyase [Sphingomonadales bacterium]MBK9587440.1 methylaspartate ammonia-lyase [Sphingomonadales bacterium]MBL0117212.1 methylaspartate ammonia-lyase [Sphingomonadales bacterium]
MKIRNVYFSKGFSAFYFDDQAAIKAGAKQDGFVYCGSAQTEGFSAIRQSGECISITLELEDGQFAQGDCAAVQYSGAAGRDSLFSTSQFIPLLEEKLKPRLIGLDVGSFLESSKWLDELANNPHLSHTAIQYGVSQALLEASAKSNRATMCEIVCQEWNLPLVSEPLKLFGQSGDDRYSAVDKMILKGVSALPHGLINNVPKKLGEEGGKLAEYVAWLSHRILALRDDAAYHPTLHIDVYGTIGLIFDNDAERIADYLVLLEARADPFQLYIEGPADAGSKAGQIALLKLIREALYRRGSSVKIVADEWCNTLNDVKDFADEACCDMVQIKTPEQAVAAPLASCHFAQGGARVIKIEREDGDFARRYDLAAKGSSSYFVWAILVD